MKKTDSPRTGLSGYKDGTMKLPSDDNDTTAFGYNNPGNADKGVPGLVKSSASLLVGTRESNDGSLDPPQIPSRETFTHGGDTVIASR